MIEKNLRLSVERRYEPGAIAGEACACSEDYATKRGWTAILSRFVKPVFHLAIYFFSRDQAKSECDWVVMHRNIRPKFAVFCFITFLFCAPCFASAH